MKRQLSTVISLIIFLSSFGQNVGIGTNSPLDYAKLQIESSSSGLMMPRLSDVEMNALGNNLSGLGQAIASQYNGMLIYNSDDFRIYVWDTASNDFTNGGWKNMLVADDLDSLTLDDAYNNGGGLIEADNGPLNITTDGMEVSGTFGIGAFPFHLAGSGPLMAFNPRLAAFRAGASYGEWSLGNVGDYSTAFGNGAEASGNNSFAVGQFSEAAGDHAIAMGYTAQAFSDNGIAIGNFAYALDQGSVAIGDNSDVIGVGAVALGRGSLAQGFDAFAFNGGIATGQQAIAGSGGTVNSPYGIAIGEGAQVGLSSDYSVAIGQNATASGLSSYALGDGASASGDHSTAMGGNTSASGLYSFSFGDNSFVGGDHAVGGGYGAIANGAFSIAIGNTPGALSDHAIALGNGAVANATGSVAIGSGADANGLNSVAIGLGTTTLYEGEAAFGKYNLSSSAAIIPVDQIFSVGVGAFGGPENAITVLDGGLVGIGVGAFNPTHTLHVAGSPGQPPLLIDGLTTDNTQTGFLVADASGSVFVRDINSFDSSPGNELQTISRAGLDVTLSNGGGTVSIADNDNDPRNEFQTITIAGSDITLSDGGGTVTVPSSADNLGNHSATTNLQLNNYNITEANSFSFNDVGDQEGILWTGSAAKIFVSPLNSGNSDGYLRIINDGGISIEPGTEDTEEVIIEANGNVGLGIVPTERLDIGGNIQLNDNNILGGDDIYVNDFYNDGEEDAVEFQADMRMGGSFVIEMPNNMEYSQQTTNQDFTSGYGNVQEVSIDVKAGQKVLLQAHVAWDHDDEEWVRFRFYRDGSAIGEDMEEEEDDVTGSYSDNTVSHLMWVDEPGAGTYTYSIRMDGNDNTTKRVYNVSLVAMIF